MARWQTALLLGALMAWLSLAAAPARAADPEPGPLTVRAYVAPFEPTSAANFSVRVWVAVKNPSTQPMSFRQAEVQFRAPNGDVLLVERLAVPALAAGEEKKLPVVYFGNDSRFEVTIRCPFLYAAGGKDYEQTVQLDRHHPSTPSGFTPDW